MAAYPGMSLIMVRSFIEHRAGETAAERTAIVDAGWFWRLLFLNNNYHWVHHRYPSVAWYLIPERWSAERDEVLARNGRYYLPGYAAVAWRWLLRSREPVIHPFLRRPDGLPVASAEPVSCPAGRAAGAAAAVGQALAGVVAGGDASGPQQPAA
jgi:fatty acid desaturase